MSGRSAYVRKEKTKLKDGDSNNNAHDSPKRDADPMLESFPMPVGAHRNEFNFQSSRKQAKSVGSTNSDDMAYARVKKPVLPPLDVSGIEKSSFRELMDKKSEGVRRQLAGMGFGRKKKKNAEAAEQRPETSTTIRPTHYEQESVSYDPPPSRQRYQGGVVEEGQPGPPPYGKLPSVPPAPQLKRWAGHGRPPHPWNKLRKDPELWDPHGDTLIFLAHETHQDARPPPSMRVSSHILEATGSRVLIKMLREGYIDFYSDSEMASPNSSHGTYSRNGQRFYRTGQPAPLMSENASQDPDGQISYELYFPAPINQSRVESIRHHATTRNVFALLYQTSLVGLDMLQTLRDLHERLQKYMPSDTDSSELIIDYITSKRLDDARNDPATAISLLVWSEGRSVRWQEGWREFFVHCVGMHNSLDTVPEVSSISPITKALLERASLEVEVRLQLVADRLVDFNFSDMWPAMQPQQPPERASFERLRLFLRSYYEASYGSWPPPAPAKDGIWLSRNLVKGLQSDFGALYDYLVNRDVVWDCSEQRSSRKWNMASSNPEQKIRVDTEDLPMTDILVAFDNLHRYPHIPHPYSLVPESMPVPVKENLFKASKKAAKQVPVEDKMTERKVALAYTEATNIYLLGSDFVSNKLADAFVRFEKSDRPSEVDPFAARRGRWVLVYGILQTLASVSVDNPALRYKEDVSYHLNAHLRGTPPWKSANTQVEEATHEGSYCWLAPKIWTEPSEVDVPMLDSLSVSVSVSPVVSPRDRPLKLAGSIRSSAANSATGAESYTREDKSPRDKPAKLAASIRSSAATSAAGTENDLWGDKSTKLSLSVRSSTVNSTTGTESDTGSSIKSPAKSSHGRSLRWIPRGTVKEIDHLGLTGGYGPGIQKVDEWPIREESRENSFSESQVLMIKDFDDYEF